MHQDDDTMHEINEEGEREPPVLHSTQLPKPLTYLFILNGVTEALPDLALMAMVNDRIQIPVSFLPAYYAISFLPYSLKPVYAIVAKMLRHRRNVLLIALLISSSIAMQLTAFLENGQYVECFLIAFVRGICVSAAEFMVGLTLISSASNSIQSSGFLEQSGSDAKINKQRNHEKLLSCYQSQAATSRNIGSFMAHIVTFGVILVLNDREMDDSLMTNFLLATSLFPLIAAAVAFKSQIGREVTGLGNYRSSDLGNQRRSIMGLLKYDIIAILMLQALLVMFGLQGLIVDSISKDFFVILSVVVALLMTMAVLLAWKSQRQSRYSALAVPNDESIEEDGNDQLSRRLLFIKRIAMYLILRHATPSSGIILSSFMYSVFRKRLLLLQSMSLAGSVMAIFSTWTYGKTLARRFASLDRIKLVIIITTIASSIWSLLSIPFVRNLRELQDDDEDDDDIALGVVLITLYTVFQLVGSFLSELSFMPSVVLATTSTIQEDFSLSDQRDQDVNEAESCRNISFQDDEANQRFRHNGIGLDSGIQYGILIACIDFGDQLSNFITMPIIEALGISRENDWQNLEWYIFVCSVSSIASLVFVLMLKSA